MGNKKSKLPAENAIQSLSIDTSKWITEFGIEGGFPVLRADIATVKPILLDDHMHAMDQIKLILIRGKPGSGKSTQAKQLASKEYRHFEVDMHFEHGGIYKFDPRKLSEARAWCLQLARRSLKLGSRVVVSNTFSRRKHLLPYLDLVPCALVLEMAGNWKNVHGVADSTIKRIVEKWQPLMA
jgi:hypothetical protein